MPAPNEAELLSLMSTGLALVEGDGRVCWINAALAEMLDVGPRTAMGQRLTALLREPSLDAQLARTLADGRAFNLRGTSFAVARGRELLADLTTQPVDGGRVLVELHPLASDIVPAATPLSATLRGFAHEVKNPLAGLRGAIAQAAGVGARSMKLVRVGEVPPAAKGMTLLIFSAATRIPRNPSAKVVHLHH